MDLEIKKFSEIDLRDSFFDSLRDSYDGFDNWYAKKSAEGAEAYVFYDEDNNISDFLYLKIENGVLNDVIPVLPAKKRLKVGTFKLISRGTKRGERFMKKIMDRAINEDVDEIYVTIFPTNDLQYLIKMFEKYGFKHLADKKHDGKEDEWVLVRNMRSTHGDIVMDYPFVKTKGVNKYLLSVYPLYHTKLFPDSILNNESYDIVQDITPTNGIYKVYICWMKDAVAMKKGDNVVIYRTNDNKGHAYYRSVATSICTVREIQRYSDFKNLDDFLKQMEYSVFDNKELRSWYINKKNFVVIKMLYNVSFSKKVIRKTLLEDVAIPKNVYWGCCKLSDEQYKRIIELGGANERYFID